MSASLGRRRTADWVTMAGVVGFTAGNIQGRQGRLPVVSGAGHKSAGRKKSSRGTGCVSAESALETSSPEAGSGTCLLGSGLGVAVAEALHAATHVVHALLRAGVEGVRLAGGVELEQRQFAAVFQLDHFLRVGAGARHELEVVGQVHETDFAVVGVNAVFHDVSLGSGAAAATEPFRCTCRKLQSL